MSQITVDLNVDLGEGFGAWKMGRDDEILPFVSSINVACGFHAGDHNIMHDIVKKAVEQNIAIGAHPGFQDLIGFGRRNMPLSSNEVYNLVMYQIGALQGFTHAYGIKLHHVKPHGALYNMSAKDPELALAIAQAVKDATHDEIILYGLAGSAHIRAGESLGIRVANEGFVDRRYLDDGSLAVRGTQGAVIEREEDSIKQVLQMVKERTVTTITGKCIEINVDTICIHGDGAHALPFLHAVRKVLSAQHIVIKTL